MPDYASHTGSQPPAPPPPSIPRPPDCIPGPGVDYAKHAAIILADPWPAIKQQLGDRIPSLLLSRDGILGTRVAESDPPGDCDGSGRIHPDRRLGP